MYIQAPHRCPRPFLTPVTRSRAQVDYLYLIDDVGNGAYFTAADLAARGHPIRVLLPAPFHRALPPPAAPTSDQQAGADAEVGPNVHVDGRPV